MAGALFMALQAGSLPAYAAEPVPASAYGLSLQHRLLSTVPLDERLTGLELELTLHNAGQRDLYDLRLVLDRVDGSEVVAHEPARLQALAAGESASVTWTFEGLLMPPSPEALASVQVRIEAVDTTTQEIVGFALASQGE